MWMCDVPVTSLLISQNDTFTSTTVGFKVASQNLRRPRSFKLQRIVRRVDDGKSSSRRSCLFWCTAGIITQVYIYSWLLCISFLDIMSAEGAFHEVQKHNRCSWICVPMIMICLFTLLQYILSNHHTKIHLCSYLFRRHLVCGSWPNCQGKWMCNDVSFSLYYAPSFQYRTCALHAYYQF